jgi:microsomal triglyceride transfer protein large subunit
LCDLVGATQTVAAHEAARKFLHLDSESDLDMNERYFWALSFGSHPQHEIIKGEALTVVLMVIRANGTG